MKEEKTITINTAKDIPTLEEIQSISRGLKLNLIFEGDMQPKRSEVGEQWQQELPEFSIEIQLNGKEISIHKLITVEEIEQHQAFFEDCAKEYGILGEQLITQFIEQYDVVSHGGYPLITLNPYGKSNYRPSGEMGDWKFHFHRFHCAFTHKETEQHIEVPLVFGEEYGVLDPYFFAMFIKTTPRFQPSPVPIFDYHQDGNRIFKVMVKLGKFEEINSNIQGKTGIIVSDRVKKEVIPYPSGMQEILTGEKFHLKKIGFMHDLIGKTANRIKDNDDNSVQSTDLTD